MSGTKRSRFSQHHWENEPCKAPPCVFLPLLAYACCDTGNNLLNFLQEALRSSVVQYEAPLMPTVRVNKLVHPSNEQQQVFWWKLHSHNLFCVIFHNPDGIKEFMLQQHNKKERFSEKKSVVKKETPTRHFQQLLVCIIKVSIFLILKKKSDSELFLSEQNTELPKQNKLNYWYGAGVNPCSSPYTLNERKT